MWKTAARAGLRQIGKMVQQGNLAGASSLAKAPGVLKPSVAGSQIRHLGQGSEGLATLVAHPEHGVAVRKLYDPRGLSSPSMIARKEEVGRSLQGNQNFAQFHGSAPTPHGGSTMHFNEYIPGAAGPSGAARDASVARTGQAATQAIQRTGYEAHDLHSGNMLFDPRHRQHRVVDYLPAKPGEVAGMTPDKALEVTPQGHYLFNDNIETSSRGDMLGRMLGGRSVATKTIAAPALAPATVVQKKPRPLAPAMG